MTSMKICPNCKVDNLQYANYCRHCGAKFGNVPEIESFDFMSNPYVGDSIELSWNVINADSVALNGLTMPLNHHYKIVVDREMTWELVATKAGKRVSKRIHIVPTQVSDKITYSTPHTKKRIASTETMSYLVKAFITVMFIDIVPLVSLLIISLGSSWLRYTLNSSYNEWNSFCLYANTLLWIWVIAGVVYGCFKFYHYKKI